MNSFLTAAARTLTSKRGSWLVLGGVVVVVALIFGLLSGAREDRPTENAPADSESTQAQQILVEFPEADRQSVMVVASNDDGSELSADDQAQLKKLGSSLGQRSEERRVGNEGRARPRAGHRNTQHAHRRRG